MTYFMDYKIPKYLEPLYHRLSTEFWKEYGSTIYPNIRPTSKLKSDQALMCLCLNLCSHTAYGKDKIPITLDQTHYSYPLIYNCALVKRKISYPHTLNVLNWMNNSGRANLVKGCVASWNIGEGGVLTPSKMSYGYLELSPEFLKVIQPYADKRQLPTLESVIEMKDEEKKLITKELEDYQIWVVGRLNEYNKLARQTSVTIDGIEVDFQLKKVYNNNSWDEGGRNYIVGSGIADGLLWRENRPRILIDGEETVEIDFKSLHPRMCAALDDTVLVDDFDPYMIEMEGFTRIGIRTIAKISLLVALNNGYRPINRENALSTVKAIRSELYRSKMLHKLIENGDVPDMILYRDILEALMERNQYLYPWVIEPKGMFLQNLDSQIMDIIVDHFNKKEIVIIPVHDSIVIQKQHMQEGIDVMKRAYRAVMKSDRNCVVEVK